MHKEEKRWQQQWLFLKTAKREQWCVPMYVTIGQIRRKSLDLRPKNCWIHVQNCSMQHLGIRAKRLSSSFWKRFLVLQRPMDSTSRGMEMDVALVSLTDFSYRVEALKDWHSFSASSQAVKKRKMFFLFLERGFSFFIAKNTKKCIPFIVWLILYQSSRVPMVSCKRLLRWHHTMKKEARKSLFFHLFPFFIYINMV